MGYARQQRGIVDLVPVEIQDGQHRAIANGIEKLVDVPRSSQRTCLGFTIPDHCRDDQIWIVKGGAARVRQNVTQLATFVDRAGCFGSAVTADTAGKRKLFEEPRQAVNVLAFLWINLRVGSFNVNRPQHAGRAVTGTSHVNHVEVELLYDAIQMGIYKGERRTGAPMS